MASSTIAQAVRKSRALGPSVKNLMAQYQLDLNQIVSTGPHQILLKADVLAYISQKNLHPNSSTGKALDTLQQFSKPSAFSRTKSSTKPTVFHMTDKKILNSKYARKYPTQLEIDVINAGGLGAI